MNFSLFCREKAERWQGEEPRDEAGPDPRHHPFHRVSRGKYPPHVRLRRRTRGDREGAAGRRSEGGGPQRERTHTPHGGGQRGTCGRGQAPGGEGSEHQHPLQRVQRKCTYARLLQR